MNNIPINASGSLTGDENEKAETTLNLESGKVKIAYFYPRLLNLYGDNGNVEILAKRLLWRGIPVEIVPVEVETIVTDAFMADVDLVFMGGGPDAKQKEMYADLLENKGIYLRKFIESDGPGLFICGSYQLLGKYYKASDGTVMEGLGVFDLYTEHFGPSKPRCIGNTYATLRKAVISDPEYEFVLSALNRSLGFGASENMELSPVSKESSGFSNIIVGFENHGGRTFLGPNISALATVNIGHGNNSEDGTEGVFYKNSIGTYFHGPFLAKNPHIADLLLAKALKRKSNGTLDVLSPVLNDNLVYKAYIAAQKLKQ